AGERDLYRRAGAALGQGPATGETRKSLYGVPRPGGALRVFARRCRSGHSFDHGREVAFMTEQLPEMVLEGGAPIHRQIHGRIRDCIVRGMLRPGDELPTVRMAAVELAVNPNAVLRAYADLEGEGLLTSGEGCGILVKGRAAETGAEQNPDGS